MSRIFKPKIVMPPVPPAPEPIKYNPPSNTTTEQQIANTPTKEEIAAVDPTEAIETDAEKKAIKTVEKKKKGRKSTILTGPQGLTTDAETYNPTLLG